MALLELERIGKRYKHGARVALNDVSMEIQAGEMIVVWGERQSGRSTLLRIAAGIETPDTGTVRFDGGDLTTRDRKKLGEDVGYCRRDFRRRQGPTVLDQLIAGQLGRRVPQPVALAHAWGALERVQASPCAEFPATELKTDETVRVAIARALTCSPRLLVIDEPTLGVELLDRDGILKLLRSLADDGMAILSSTGEGTGFLGADRVLALDKGKLEGELTPDLAPVSDLTRHRQARG
ncbi:MAG TPA: ATP-binding cassette domain-containing protein [Solirubrobacteraceae bacterium]|jgi:energy-coupling factor transporter ATP-binding protein EcfA2|nr:ATP-binding cassette domain-containing protein [Solirubrobacteraceae bacterium]